MKRKYIKKLIDTKELSNYFDMQKVDIYKHFARGDRLDFVYIVLNNDDLTIREKKTYLYKTSMTPTFKNTIWQKFSGDYGFYYNRSNSNSFEFKLFQEGGTV